MSDHSKHEQFPSAELSNRLELDSSASSSEVGMVFQLSDGTIQACNSAAETLLGVTLAQMQNTTSRSQLWQTIQADGSPFPGNAHPAMKVLQTGQPIFGVVMGIYRPDDTLLWIAVDAQPLFQDANPAPWAAVATFWQIPRPEQALLQSAESNPLLESSSKRSTLLLVEDCYEDQVAICHHLEHNSDHAHEVLVANTCAAGLEICRTTPVDLVLLDYGLSDLGAIAFLKALRNHSNQPALPVVVITGQGNETIAVQLLKAGVKDYLVKGQLTAQSLQSSIGNVLRQNQITKAVQLTSQKERLITQIGRQIHRSLDLDKVLEATVWEVRQFLQTDRVLVFQLEPNSAIGHVVAEAVEAPWQSLLANSFGDPCLIQSYAQAYRQGKVTAISDLALEPVAPCYQAFLNHLEVRATLVVPILREDTLWGLLIAHHCRDSRLWDPIEIDLLKQLSTQVGIALHRVELYLQIQQKFTEQQQTAQRLLESQERLQLGVQVAGVGLAKFDYATNTVELSPEAAQLYGLPADELVVSRDLIHSTFHPDERSELAEIIRQVLDPTGIGWFARDHRILWSTGETRWLSVRKQVFFNGSGASAEPAYAMLAAVDITARKQADIEREQLLAKERVARSQAERANRLKDEFLAVLSHELRSPLNPILGWANLLQRKKLDENRTQHALSAIERNAKLQAQLIDDLLDISRIMHGKLTLNTSAVNLESVIRAALETIQLSASTKNIQIDLDFPTHCVQVSGDAGRLQQVIWNLLSNAVKFTPSGGQVQVVLTQREQQAEIKVTDTGKGIAPDFLPHVFEHFRQEDGAITRKFGGLGLGLAITQQVVELHGGMIRVNSLGENQGATFIVHFPLSAQSASNSTGKIAAASVLETAPLAGIQVLIVDDDLDTREFLSFLLVENGAVVTTAASASQALQALKQSHFDVLLSDIGMADMDGYALMRQIKEGGEQTNASIWAIALTAYAGEFDQQQARSAGFHQHLAKPIDSDQLITLVTELIRPS